MSNLQRVIGRLIMVQESRFRISTVNGQSYLLSLAHTAGTNETDLLELYRSGIPVAVEFEGEPELESGLVHRVQPL